MLQATSSARRAGAYSRERRIALGLIVASIAALGGVDTILTNDVRFYRRAVAALMGGSWPYLEHSFEHLPLALIPMVLAWLLGGFLGEVPYAVVFAGCMGACLLGTLVLVERLGAGLGAEEAGRRWMFLTAPLFPLVLFRSDPWVVVLTVAALAGMASGRWWSAPMGLAAVAAKGWPAALAVLEWWRDRRREALVLPLFAAGLAGLLLATPGFREGRRFAGVQMETVSGSAVLLWRVLSGSETGVIPAAGSVYVAVGVWAVALNVVLGLVLGGLALRALSAPFDWPGGIRLITALVVALLVASPLLSAQFFLWLTPFLALHDRRDVYRLGLAAVVLTMAGLAGFWPAVGGQIVAVLVLNLRNLVLLVLGWRASVASSGG